MFQPVSGEGGLVALLLAERAQWKTTQATLLKQERASLEGPSVYLQLTCAVGGSTKPF